MASASGKVFVAIKFPFWLVHSNTRALAFSTLERLEAFLIAGLYDYKVISTVDEHSLCLLVAALRENGHTSVCTDPNHDGFGGISLCLDEIEATFRPGF